MTQSPTAAKNRMHTHDRWIVDGVLEVNGEIQLNGPVTGAIQFVFAQVTSGVQGGNLVPFTVQLTDTIGEDVPGVKTIDILVVADELQNNFSLAKTSAGATITAINAMGSKTNSDQTRILFMETDADGSATFDLVDDSGGGSTAASFLVEVKPVSDGGLLPVTGYHTVQMLQNP